MRQSFILFPAPELCGDQPFKKHRMIFHGKAKGRQSEFYNLIAINCPTRDLIAKKIEDISSYYISQPANHENIRNATWSAACRSVLMNEPFGLKLSDDAKKLMATYHIKLDEEKCLYLMLDESALSYIEHLVRAEMQSCD